MGVMIMIKRIGSVLMIVLLGIMFNVLLTAATDIYYGEGGTVEAAVSQPRVKLTQRELKKSPDYETSDLYARAHHIIYGDKAPLGPGGRVRIAVVINGEEDFIVEDRVKNQIYSQLRQKFPRDQFAIMKGTDVNTRLLEYAEKQYTDAEFEEKIKQYKYCSPFTKESLLYREIFESYYPEQAGMIKDFWMPNKNWQGCNVNDPSARYLSNYGDSGK